MGFIVNLYQKNFLQRYDVPEANPFPVCEDYPGLACTESAFRNSSGVEIRYFFFSRGNTIRTGSFCSVPALAPDTWGISRRSMPSAGAVSAS